jgi:hypothetical protein
MVKRLDKPTDSLKRRMVCSKISDSDKLELSTHE